jgi:membrane protease YdiL (CAAX protease family)
LIERPWGIGKAESGCGNVDRRRVSAFLGLTYLLSWLIALLLYLSGSDPKSAAAVTLLTAYMFVPMGVTLFLKRFVYAEEIRDSLGLRWLPNRWWLVGWLWPVAYVLLTVGCNPIIPGVELSWGLEGVHAQPVAPGNAGDPDAIRQQTEQLPVHTVWSLIVLALVAGATINALAGLGEEVGWRGFLQFELRSMGFWRSSLAIGFVWGAWHAPLVLQGHNYPQHPVVGTGLMIVWCTLLAPLFSYVRLRSGSVIAAAIMHGTLNSTAGLALVLTRGGDDLTVGATGVVGVALLLAMNAALFSFDRSLVREEMEDLLKKAGG